MWICHDMSLRFIASPDDKIYTYYYEALDSYPLAMQHGNEQTSHLATHWFWANFITTSRRDIAFYHG